MFGVVIAFILGVFVGLLVAWYPLRQQNSTQKAQIDQLQFALGDKDHDLQRQAAEVGRLQSKVGQHEETTRDLTALVDWRKTTIDQLKEAIVERDGQIEEFKVRAEAADVKIGEPQISVTEPDNLKRIEGIGPKISALLQDAGIMTFQQLADTAVSRLEQILSDAQLPLADPTTWPEQAKLAATGDWTILETLQDELKGGRKA